MSNFNNSSFAVVWYEDGSFYTLTKTDGTALLLNVNEATEQVGRFVYSHDGLNRLKSASEQAAIPVELLEKLLGVTV